MPLARAVRHLRDYVAIPSVNPMLRSDVPPEVASSFTVLVSFTAGYWKS